ncbi:MAG TPA: maleylpyruvate isomerase N-terminal domain-containing protein, partial [Actinomycetota bacterium]|nr:maleylpyruvate isomerase N-terminal domain-containing protein [Actinomycetota bacterium]
AVFEEVGPDAPAWTWHGENDVAFWIRRMAQETAVHCWDAENAIGSPTEIDAELAADGIDEFVDKFIALDEIAYEGPSGTVHLHCEDTEDRWTVSLDPGKVPTFGRGPADADAVVRAPAHNLLLWIWRRLGSSSVEVSGAPALADAFWYYAEGPGQ